MPTTEQLQALMTGTESNRVEALRQMLAYPVKQLDPEGSRFWFLRPGVDKLEAADTLPIAVGFYSELNEATHQEIVKFLTSKEQPQEIYGHYISRRNPENQPVMYLLLPSFERTGRVALVLPTEGGLRQRQIQTFAWNEQELLGRLSRLKQGELPIAIKALYLIPLVEWVFYEAAKTAQELARELAKVTRSMEQAIPQVYAAEKADGYLRNLLVSFQRELLPTLQLTSTNEKDYSFADIYAQTIAYGLFTARVFSYVKDERQGRDKETDFNRQDAWQQLPETNPFLRSLFEDVSKRSPAELGDELIDAISEVFSILRAAKMDAILSDFRQKMNREDIVIRFYEDFLAAYKPEMRRLLGVYYTPEAVVSYMVRSVDELLKDKFNKPLGLADPEVMILDPACGTGTFLLWICQLIHQRFQESPDALTEGLADKSWSGYVRERLLPRIFGFELLMAPYAIAHLKLGLFLEETGYQFDGGKRLGVYLTNTLDDAIRKTETLFEEFIAQEADQATEIKRDLPIMVVVGNPPYSYESGNTGAWISFLIRDYYKVDGNPLGERNPKGLQDDYVKFIRFAQWRILQTGHGILAFISNHSYLDNPTFRGMRQSLKTTFSNIYALDLHGNTVKRERNPNGSEDKNVFDIQQGVAIAFFLKIHNQAVNDVVCHAELWGKREEKYKYLFSKNINTTPWKIIKPQFPTYFLVPQNTDLLTEYEEGWKLTELMPINSVGLYTARDSLAIQWTKADMRNALIDIVSLDAEVVRSKYNLPPDARDWKVSLAQKDVQVSQLEHTRIQPISYRPFDTRFTYYTGISRGFICMPRSEVMRHMVNRDNLALCCIRRSREQVVSNFFVAKYLIDKTILSSADNANVAPLYLYPERDNPQQSVLKEERRPNFSQAFLNAISDQLGYTPAPEAIFYYIYAIFHSPTYRTRYAEFLKIDFPRVPLTRNDELFRQLATYGEELVALHLMKSPKLDNLITEFVENGGSRLVETGKKLLEFNEGSVIINKKGDKFTGIPENVWNFYVGGYQVCQKWLKDRKGRSLSDDDIQHYQRIVVALKETIELMSQIDEAIPGFPIE